MPRHVVDSVDHPLLEPFREIRSRNWTEQSGLFIVEGPLLVESLLLSSYAVRSVLLDRKYLDHYQHLVDDSVDLLLVEHDFVQEVVGFNFHRGILGCGLRKPTLSLTRDFVAATNHRETLVCAVGVQDPENLGGILRSAAALGIERVIIGPGTADPLCRRVLRVSMGTALRLQLFRSQNVLSDLQWLREACQIDCVATTLQANSEPLEMATRQGPVLILVGNERHGLPAQLQATSDRRVNIEMNLGTDSLNVSVAAAIVMHHFCRIA